jgi:hypothetical protein
MTRDQKIVGIGAASGIAAMIVAIAGIYQLWPSSPSLVDISSRLAYALQANAFAVIPLLRWHHDRWEQSLSQRGN